MIFQESSILSRQIQAGDSYYHHAHLDFLFFQKQTLMSANRKGRVKYSSEEKGTEERGTKEALIVFVNTNSGQELTLSPHALGFFVQPKVNVNVCK